MKHSTAQELAIRFVLDRHDRHHDVATLGLRDIHAQPDGRHAFRCASCLEPVAAKAGFIRRPYFAHSPVNVDTPVCPWRTDLTPCAFHGRNPSGDDGKWHIDSQCEIMTILEMMGCHPTRNAAVRTDDGLRKPDIAVTLDGQLLHFEIQASPTDAWCAARRTHRDFRHSAATIWIVSAPAFRTAIEHGAVPAWVETLAAMGGGQIWLWDAECYRRSQHLGWLSPLRSTIEDPSNLATVDLPVELPRVVPFSARLNHAGRMQLRYPVTAASLPRMTENLVHLRDALAKELDAIGSRLGHSYRYDYGLACLNTPCPIFTIFEGDRLASLRQWFDRQSPDKLATDTRGRSR